jgi:hypothetical protein
MYGDDVTPNNKILVCYGLFTKEIREINNVKDGCARFLPSMGWTQFV